MNKLRVAIIGAGHLGRIHAKLLAERNDVLLVGVADPDPEARRQVAAVCDAPAVADHRELLEQADAAIVAAPTRWHHEIALDALNRGLHAAGGKTARRQRPRSRRTGRRGPASRRRPAGRARRTVQSGAVSSPASFGRTEIHRGGAGRPFHRPQRGHRRRAGPDDPRHRRDAGFGRALAFAASRHWAGRCSGVTRTWPTLDSSSKTAALRSSAPRGYTSDRRGAKCTCGLRAPRRTSISPPPPHV